MEKKKRFETNYDHHKSNSRKEKVEGGYVWVGGVGGGAYNRIFLFRVGEGCYKRQFTDMLTGRWA